MKKTVFFHFITRIKFFWSNIRCILTPLLINILHLTLIEMYTFIKHTIFKKNGNLKQKMAKIIKQDNWKSFSYQSQFPWHQRSGTLAGLSKRFFVLNVNTYLRFQQRLEQLTIYNMWFIDYVL